MGEQLYNSRKSYMYDQGEKVVLVQFKKSQVHGTSDFFNLTSTIFAP